MSTKTTFKRIALVAVAALGLSVLSVAPSTAAADSVTLGATTSAATTAVEVTNTISLSAIAAVGTTGETITATVVLVSAPLTSTLPGVLPKVTITETQSAAGVNADSSTAGAVLNVWAKAGGRYTAAGTIAVTPDVPGVYVYRITPSNVGALTVTAQTWTVTAIDPTQKSATAFVNTTGPATVDALAAALTFTSTASATKVAVVTVKQYSTADTLTPVTAAISKDVVVGITKGLVSKTDDYLAGSTSVTLAGGVAAAIDSSYYVFANGNVGTASLTVTVGGVLVATKTIVFKGLATSLSAALTTGGKWIAPAATAVLTVSPKDSAAGASSNTPVITAVSSDTKTATVTVSGLTVTILGVAAGTSVITIADAATTTPATSTTYTVTVAPTLSATLPTLTFNKAEYAAGELMTITFAAAAADNVAFAAFTAAPTISVSVVNLVNPFTLGAVALVEGKATWTAYAPITPGPVTITATSGAGVVSTVTAAVVAATAAVVSDGVAQAAVDAAAEAKDAADAATDAANTAAEAADAATAAAQDAADAVAALATSVEAMITALKKQITALTNLVIKIQKKVKA
jgi:hypothetical protein